jgi:hypothetical protein
LTEGASTEKLENLKKWRNDWLNFRERFMEIKNSIAATTKSQIYMSKLFQILFLLSVRSFPFEGLSERKFIELLVEPAFSDSRDSVKFLCSFSWTQFLSTLSERRRWLGGIDYKSRFLIATAARREMCYKVPFFMPPRWERKFV